MSEELELLRWCLHGGTIPQAAYKICWHDLLEFAKKQAIVGVYWQGISQLGSMQANKPTDDDVMEWMAAIQHLEKKNRKANEKAVWVSGTFMKEGFRSCLLKGQGNALLYPTPLGRHRYLGGGRGRYSHCLRPPLRAKSQGRVPPCRLHQHKQYRGGTALPSVMDELSVVQPPLTTVFRSTAKRTDESSSGAGWWPHCRAHLAV